MPIEEAVAVAVADNAHDHVQSTGPGREIIDLTQGLMRLPWGADEYRARYLPAWENREGYTFYGVAVAEVV